MSKFWDEPDILKGSSLDIAERCFAFKSAVASFRKVLEYDEQHDAIADLDKLDKIASKYIVKELK